VLLGCRRGPNSCYPLPNQASPAPLALDVLAPTAGWRTTRSSSPALALAASHRYIKNRSFRLTMLDAPSVSIFVTPQGVLQTTAMNGPKTARCFPLPCGPTLVFKMRTMMNRRQSHPFVQRQNPALNANARCYKDCLGPNTGGDRGGVAIVTRSGQMTSPDCNCE
jgi:hypothetical protein